jgi:ribonuclease HII
MTAHFEQEAALRARKIWPVVGIDEVGRGPLAGPVCAAAVILDPNNLPLGVNDSKKLNAARREQLYEEIMARALAVGFASASAAEIDAINIRQATLASMRRATAALALRPAYALVDGCDPPRLNCEVRTIVKGDSISLSIAAASIVAKVTRDRLMARLDGLYPGYGFARHAGYATAAHRAALEALGPCPVHRRSFAPERFKQWALFE